MPAAMFGGLAALLWGSSGLSFSIDVPLIVQRHHCNSFRKKKTAVYAGLDCGPNEVALLKKLETREAREAWLRLLEHGHEDWEEVKLALGLLWKKAAVEGRDGGPLGYPMALTRLLEGIYEGPDGDAILVADIEARLTQVPAGDPGDPDQWRRSVALGCFKELGFVARGL